MVLFKRCKDDENWETAYELYDMRGEIFYAIGNIRMQVTTVDKIYFYLVDEQKCSLCLENVMYNFMQCNQLMFGPRVLFAISYNYNEPDLIIYTRGHFHNFMVSLDKDGKYSNAAGANMPKTNEFIVSSTQHIATYDNRSFKQKGRIHVHDIFKTRKDKQIFFLSVSPSCNRVGMTIGEYELKHV